MNNVQADEENVKFTSGKRTKSPRFARSARLLYSIQQITIQPAINQLTATHHLHQLFHQAYFAVVYHRFTSDIPEPHLIRATLDDIENSENNKITPSRQKRRQGGFQ